MRKKIKILLFVSLLSLTALCAHIFNIAAVKQASYAQNAASERRSTKIIKKYRGGIYDKNMIPIVDSKAENITLADGLIAECEKRYPDGTASHITGYTLSDGSGASGVEKAFDSVLTSDAAKRAVYMTDAAGGKLKKTLTELTDSKPSRNIKLTIDATVQKIAEKYADEYIENGAIVILDTASFDTVAMVSRPNFDRNNVENVLSGDNSPLLNRALSPYNAGSIFKIITTAAYLENGGDESRIYPCRGYVTADGMNFKCNSENGHGELNLKNAFAKSCNSYFYSTAMNIGADVIIDEAKKFSLGDTLLSCDLDESPGHLPQMREFSLRDAANAGIGQGEILITPLQAANMACIIASGGTMRDINIADSIVSPDGTTIKVLRNNGCRTVISRRTAYAIGEMMREAVLEGTAQSAQNGVVAIAGKTGTAETGWNKDGTPMVHGWFCGFFPYDNPKYAMAVFAEDGRSGSAACIPAFRQIALDVMKCR